MDDPMLEEFAVSIGTGQIMRDPTLVATPPEDEAPAVSGDHLHVHLHPYGKVADADNRLVPCLVGNDSPPESPE